MTRRHFFFSFGFLYLGIFQESELSQIQSETKMKETFFLDSSGRVQHR